MSQKVSILIRNLANEGKAVLLVSGEFDEIEKIAERVLVIADGRIIEEIVRGQGEISEASVLLLSRNSDQRSRKLFMMY